jgi:hypothetical protein
VIDHALSLLGLIVIGYAVWRTVVLFVEDWTHNRAVSRGGYRGSAPAEIKRPTSHGASSVRIRRPLFDFEDHEL